ncbi:hypothetical protein T552_02638 [Pneumocystis carinii B80]|uniref:Polycomb protein VEFS-Box domain-containing protein n=1 Tax=Pneumocystis carinii (strain B80) TaxID=1408658 RepID=A0A0W4ZE51_PNEC8|nr:hypothetical protein T552_02638 [Pneumocystis carinii B80]KTW26629.1 hypothetical protein T552_02638 [Pneumocystis carinii B80]
MYLTRNLKYLYSEGSDEPRIRRPQCCVNSFLFEKEFKMKDSAVWTIYMSHLKMPINIEKKGQEVAERFFAGLFLYSSSGKCVYQKNIQGKSFIDAMDNLLFYQEEPFRVPHTAFRMSRGGIKIDRICKGRLVFTVENKMIGTILDAMDVEDGFRNIDAESFLGRGFEEMNKGIFFYVTFNIPYFKASSEFEVLYFDKNGNERKTEYVLSLCFAGKVIQNTKLDLNSKITLRPKLTVKNNTQDVEDKVEIRYIFKAEESDETVVRTSTRQDFKCLWCRGKNFRTRQRLHFHFLMNHELFSFKLETNNPGFLQFEVKLANEYPSKRIGDQKMDFRVFQWIRHMRFKHNINSILLDNGESILSRNIMLGMKVEQNELVQMNIKPKPKIQLLFPLKRKNKRRFAAPKMNNLYKTMSKRKIIPGEILSESEDDIDETWLVQKHEDMLDDFMDITMSEKAFMKLWDRFIIKDRPIGHCNLPNSIMRFVHSHRNILHSENLVSEFWKHLLNLVQYKIIDLVTLRKSMEVIRNIHDNTETD